MRFIADENFDNRMLRGLLAAIPDLDILRAQDTEIYQSPDTKLLQWAAREGRILLTHDVQTMVGYAYERIKAGLPMPGVIEIDDNMPIGQAIEGLSIMIGAGIPEDFENQVRYIPLR